MSPEIPQVDDLAEVGKSAVQQGIPTIVFVSRDACPYCRSLRQSVLGPMFAADKFSGRAVLVEVSLDRESLLTNFDGRQLTGAEFGEIYRAQITPTLLFLDSEGREISKRRVGISNLELYSHYLEKSINEALGKTSLARH
ncbi:MAG: thioredoxin fold domain-containing protein [Xanthomonadales bacterium]|nr:thioredoxin fold domain-containing protein [Xanthomonadales bacterium]